MYVLPTYPAWPITWKLNNGQTKLTPVHSLDVAQALALIGKWDSEAIGATYALAGPKTYTIRELLQLVQDVTYQKIVSPEINVPRFLFSRLAKMGEKYVWWPMFNADEVTRRFIDEVPPTDPAIKGFADLGMEPDVLDDVAIMYLRRFRSHLRYEQPIQNAHAGAVPLKKEPYRVIE